MTAFKTIAAAALLSTLAATPVFAQAAIQEPGEFSFYHPDRDVLNGGAPIWGGRGATSAYAASQAYAAVPRDAIVHHVRHHRAAHANR